MRLTENFERLRSSLVRRRPRRKFRRRLFIEYLEERTVPTLIWSSAGSRMVMDEGGPVITHVDVDLVFWGAGWTNCRHIRGTGKSQPRWLR